MPPLPPSDLEAICNLTAPLWEEARQCEIFLTGGTGFFGCWLVESFLAANRRFRLNARLTVLTRSPGSFLQKCPHLAGSEGLELIAGDVRDCIFPDGEFSFVIHAATEASARQAAEQPLEMLSTILDGTRRTLDFAAASGCRKFLLTSSGAVCGTDQLQAGSVYGEGKRMSEHLCAIYAKVHGLDCKIARCWAFTGPHLPLDQHFAIGNFIRDAMAGAPIRIGGDGTPVRSYLYASDLTVWLWTMLFRGPAMLPVNVGSGEEVTIRDLAGIVADTLRPGTPIEIARQPVPGAVVNRYVPDVALAFELLNLKQTVPLAEAIRRTAAWYGYRLAQ